VNFTWDPKKAESNLRKHRVSFEEAMTVFDDEHALYSEDSLDSDRTIIIGFSLRFRLLFCVCLECEEDAFRIISAREATPHERRRYEKGD
jgi:uncharacterized DUF497 family protein